MKRMISLVALVAVATLSFGQTALELAKQQQKQNEAYMKLLNMKPTKDAKRQAKDFKKEGWTVPAGEQGIEQQLTRSQLMTDELMTDEEGNVTNRYYIHTGISTGGTYNAAYGAARANALTEVASLMKTQLAASWKGKVDNDQSGVFSATTNDRFNQRMGGIVDECITNAVPVVKLYRRVGNNFEVQVRLAFDKKEMEARLKRALKKEMETEGDELDDLVDDLLKQHLQ